MSTIDFIALQAASLAYASEQFPDSWEDMCHEDQQAWLRDYRWNLFENDTNVEFYALIDTHSDTIKEAIQAALEFLKVKLIDAAIAKELPDDLKNLDFSRLIDLNCTPAQKVEGAVIIEKYSVVAMSTAHLTEMDSKALSIAAKDSEENMVMERSTGYFIKLYQGDDSKCSNFRHGHSDAIQDIIQWAINSGYGMIEFDCDAPTLSLFPVFDW